MSEETCPREAWARELLYGFTFLVYPGQVYCMLKKISIPVLILFCNISICLSQAAENNVDYISLDSVSKNPNILRLICHVAMPWVVGNQVVESLVYVDNNNSFIPCLATGWHIEDKYMDLELRKNVFFHDGSPFNASSVENNWKIYQKTADPYFSIDLRKCIKNLKELSPYKIRIEFKENAFVGHILVYLRSFYIYSPSYFKFSNNTYPIGNQGNIIQPGNWGTGPYILKESLKNNCIAVLKKNPNYWEKSYPKISEIVLYSPKIFNSIDAHQIMKQGGADIFDAVNPSMSHIIARSPDISLVMKYPLSYLAVLFNMIKPEGVLRDIRIRKALNLSINRKILFKYVAHETARLTPFIFPLSGHDRKIKPYPYNPKLAKKLLNETGYNSNKKLIIKIAYFTSEKKLANAISLMLNEEGIDTVLQEYKTRMQLYKHFINSFHGSKNPVENETWDLIIVNIGFYSNSAVSHFGESFTSDGCCRWILPDPKADKLFFQAMQQKNLNEVNLHLEQMEEYLYDQYYAMPIYIGPSIFAVHKRIGKSSFSGSGYLLNLKKITWSKEIE